MLIPACKAYRTSYWLWFITLAGSQTYGYSLAAIPSVEAAHAQPTCTIRQISQAMKLLGSRSTRAAISPGMTRVPPPAAGSRSILCHYSSPCCHPVQGVAGKSGKGGALAVS